MPEEYFRNKSFDKFVIIDYEIEKFRQISLNIPVKKELSKKFVSKILFDRSGTCVNLLVRTFIFILVTRIQYFGSRSSCFRIS